MSISRSEAARLGQSAASILAAGTYTSASGRVVSIAEATERAVAGTVSYPPGAARPALGAARFDTEITVTGETTLAASFRLVDEGETPCALNFASAKNPGGGFLSGARAQEETLARASSLFACIDGNPMYGFHRQRRDAMYTHYAIYSPDVPVFRDDAGTLLDAPYTFAMLTSPAPNTGAVLAKDAGRTAAIEAAFAERIDLVLHLMAAHGHEVVVLGAWGCGAFRGDPKMVARLFADALRGPFAGVFRRAVFAVFDPGKGTPNRKAFEAALGQAT